MSQQNAAHKLRRRRKKSRGATMALGVALILALAVLGIGFVLFSMYFGGASETKNACDAGALNVSRQILDGISVDVNDLGQPFFMDVTNNNDGKMNDGKINLRRINRVWAKALFVAVNADAEGTNAGSTDQSVTGAFDGAQTISDALADKLTDASNLYGYFNDLAGQNNARMLGQGTSVKATSDAEGWQTSLMDRGDESNINLPGNLPLNYMGLASSTTNCTRTPPPAAATGLSFLKGYTPISISGKTFWQIPFQFEEKPHLVSSGGFADNQQPPNTLPSPWSKPVPNAFSVRGQSTNSKTAAENAISYAQTNPNQMFPMQFPYGFIRVILKQNTLHWWLDFPDGIPFQPDETYAFTVGDSTSISLPQPNCSEAMADATTGFEYTLPTLYMGIFATPPEGTAMNILVQRCKEMLPGTKALDVKAALMACPIEPLDKEQRFLIYPMAGHIVATPEDVAVLPPDCITCDKTASPEGNSYTVDTDGPIPGGVVTELGTCYGVPACALPEIPTLVSDTRSWAPGTGYQGGCLGELTVHRVTDAVVETPVCSCP